jgi:hypothetical protein
MNWKMTRARHPVRFEAEEPFCMVVPQRRGELGAFRPVVGSLENDHAVRVAFEQWEASRHEANVRKFLASYSRDFEDAKASWQQHYWRGTAPDGTEAPEHQIQLNLAEFQQES